MDSTHIVSSFDRDITTVQSLLLEMGGVVEAQIEDATLALIRRDTELADKVKKNEKRVNALEKQINEMTVAMLALRHPMAEDLRRVVATLKVSASLERMGDYAKNMAKRTSVLAKVKPVGSATNTLKRMSRMVQEMIREVLDAFVARDVKTAEEVRLRDEEVDQMHNTLFRELLTYMIEDGRKITPCMHLLFIAKNLERAGDHTANIAEQVHYLVTGETPEEARPKSDKTSTMFIKPKKVKKKKQGQSL